MRRLVPATLILTVIATAILPAAAATRQQTPPGYPTQGPSRFEPDVPPEVAVTRARTGHLLVKPRVNDRDAGWFIFDTGAGICVVSTPHVEALELEAAGSILASGFASSQADVLRAESLVLGPLVLEDLPMIALDLTFLKEHIGEEIAGVIGYGLLSRCVAEIDLVAPRVALHDPAAYALSGGAWEEMTLDTFIPVVSAHFEGHEGRFTLDTGANGAISFHAHAVEELKLIDGHATGDGKLGGVGGFIATKKRALEWIELGGCRRERIDADFEVEAKGSPDPRIAGNIGAGLLRDFVLVTDYGAKRIAFQLREEAAVDAGDAGGAGG